MEATALLVKTQKDGKELEECTALLFPTRKESIQLFWFLSAAVNKNNPTSNYKNKATTHGEQELTITNMPGN